MPVEFKNSAPSRTRTRQPLFLEEIRDKGEEGKGLWAGCVCSALCENDSRDLCMGVRGEPSTTVFTKGKEGTEESPRTGSISEANRKSKMGN